MNTKIQKRFVDEGFGFPVVLRNVEMVKVRGVWTPKVDYNHLAKVIIMALAHKPSRLTGAEVKFIRHYFKMTLTQFGNRFSVSHPGVIKWGNRKQEDYVKACEVMLTELWSNYGELTEIWFDGGAMRPSATRKRPTR